MMTSSKPSDFSLLFEVFREGLALGLISKEEVVAWADRIIIEEDEPDYFFIEIALSKSTDSLVTLIDSRFTRSSGTLPVRVILGLMYDRLKNDQMSFEKLMPIIDSYEFHRRLNRYESTCIYSFDYDEHFLTPVDISLFIEDLMNFLSPYQGFRLDNFYEWETINTGVEEVLKLKAEELARLDEIAISSNRRRQTGPVTFPKKIVINGKLLKVLSVVLPLLCLLIVVTNYEPIGGAPPTNKLMHDVYQFSVLLLEIFFGYYIMRVFYWVGKGIGRVFGGKV